MPAKLGERGTKRIASYVPKWCRDELHKLSKADLMEIAYDYAMRSVGEDAGEVAAYDELRNTAHILARCADRPEPRIQRGKELVEEHARRVERQEERRKQEALSYGVRCDTCHAWVTACQCEGA